MLVVLDSCERVIEAAAVLAEDLLRGTAGIDVLATSREPMRAEGEIVYRLPPLEVPPVASDVSATDARGYPAVQLFVECATSSNNAFALADDNASIVSQICRKLDGIPLAIELAAGHVEVFGTQGVASRLEDRIRLLTRGRRTALPRHRTLEAALDWSYDVLPDAEKSVLRRLAVFATDFSLDAALAVAADPHAGGFEFADVVANLVSKSLLNADIKSGIALYRLLDTTRAYALKKLRESGELTGSSRRHAAYFRRQLEAPADTTAPSSPIEEATAIDEARVALDWAFGSNADLDLAVGLTVACLPLWTRFSSSSECCRYVEQALQAIKANAARDDVTEMRLLAALGAALIYTKGPGPEADNAWAAALAIAEAHHDADYRIRILWGMWSSHFNSGQFEASLEIARRLREAAAQAGDADAALVGDRMAGVSMFYLGDHVSARVAMESVLRRYVRPRDRSHIVRFQFDQRVVARTVLARLLWALGLPDQAMHEVHAAVEEAHSVDHAMSLCIALAQAACPVALFSGDLNAAETFTMLLIRHAANHGLGIWHAWGKCFLATLLIERGAMREGLTALYRAFDELPQGAFYMRYSGFQVTLALAMGKSGAVENGLEIVNDVIARAERNKEHWYIAECLRIKGELLRLKNTATGRSGAEAQFLRSIDWARQQQTASWELRTTISLARLLQEQGRTAQAQTALALVYGRFTEGFQTADLRTADSLLRGLAEVHRSGHGRRGRTRPIHRN